MPFEFMESKGYTRNVLILTQPKGYRKKEISFSKILKVLLRDYPAMRRAMISRHEMYNRQMSEIEKREKKGQALVIRPPEPLGIKRTESDPDELERVYKTGRFIGGKVLNDVIEFKQDGEEKWEQQI